MHEAVAIIPERAIIVSGFSTRPARYEADRRVFGCLEPTIPARAR